ncbi:fat-like cadherin-related tumor suppressor homolog [Pararge aegeria]|nr:fat-like cadherin-related tumor suppressor homolog [Pararge aegeria]
MPSARALLLLLLCGAHAHELRFEHALYNVSVPENSAPRTPAVQPPGAPPLGVRVPGGARVRFRIRHGDRDKFFKAEERLVGDFCFLALRTRAGHDVLNRERRDLFRLDVRASAALAGRTLEADAVVLVRVTDENDLSPLFLPTEYDAPLREDVPLHASVARVAAEDADLGLNGEIYYSLAERTDRVAVHPTSGVVSVTRVPRAADGALELTVLAQDRASLSVRGERAPAARASLRLTVIPANLHAPELHVRHLPELVEGSAATVYAIVAVTDRDEGEHGRIANLDIVDGDPDGHFRVRASVVPGEFDVVAHALLDRERAPRGYNLTLRATDAGTPARAAYTTLPVTLRDTDDSAPVFSRELYEARVSETAPPNTPVIRLKVSDRDEGRNARVYIEIVGGNEGGEFAVNADTGVLYTAVALDAEHKSLYTLTVSAVDQGDAGARKQSSAKVKIEVVDANDNDPVFEREELHVTLAENGAAGAVVARVAARDADAGENAYVSYAIANLQPVPFEVDHFSGAVRTTRLLDYESMRREYALRIRASDWGLPYRRQAEMRLTVHLQDVNDNRPQFERVDCVGYLSRKLAIGSEIVTLSAIDFDSGDVVSYRIAGGNEDNCFSLDASTGVLVLACDLGDVRADSRALNVTATDGTHFADAAALTLHLAGGDAAEPGALECRDTGVARRLTELLAAAERSNAPEDFAEDFPEAPSRYGENLHYPEFEDFPVEVKVNESVALGTSLVRLRARDRDLGYNGLLVYAISGGDADSAFRIDPDTGELKVIGYLDRERESEYYLNVTVFDLGRPPRAASRLLPVTVLDVNDNAPRFRSSLASLRVTENALNGTAIFRADATDRDGGDFGRVTYSLTGAGDGEFCVDRAGGAVAVCAPLDRERRAVYELTVLATDGGGLRAEALVRVFVDDVNDNAPQFALPAYEAHVREDVPVGTVVAVLEAFDPDLGAGGVVAYSLPDQADDAAFNVDATSGTVRTAKRLDFEERQVYGVTVRATDGGQPALWAEATLIVEVADVDENAHSPVFADWPALQARVPEDAPPGTRVLAAAATDADPPGRDSRLAYYVLGGSGLAHFSVDDEGVVRTRTPLDRETTPHYWLTLCAQDQGLVPRHACVEVYIEVEDVNDMAPWPEQAEYFATVPEHCAAGTLVVRVRAHDADAAPAPVRLRYAIAAGNPDGLFAIDEASGELRTTGRALDREALAVHALEVSVSDGELASSVRVRVALADLNDHAPVFTQRFYDVRAPAGPQDDEAASVEGQESSSEAEAEAEAEADEDDEAAARDAWDEWDDDEPGGTYVTTVAALDSDAGENGTVRYSGRARGAARGLLRVHARTGRVHAAPRLLRAPRRAYDLGVRACDGARPPRCAAGRVRVRVVAAGRGLAPAVRAVAPLQAAELDAPGFLLALLQASDAEGDALYYDIVGGDPQRQFAVGREDGSLVLARRLLWEEREHYSLNVSVSDGRRAAHALVNVSVINDAHEGGVAFARAAYALDVPESARAGEALLALGAAAGRGARLLFGLHAARAPRDLGLFRLHELSGVLELARPLDREAAAVHELTVWARDQAPRASLAFARVTVRVLDDDEHAPEWGRRLWEVRVPRGAAPGALLAPLRAFDRDADDAARVRYSLAGDAAGQFAVDALGDVRLARALPAAGPREYALSVRAAGPPPAARAAALPLHVLVVEPDAAPPRFADAAAAFEAPEDAAVGAALGSVRARSHSAVRYELRGARGAFRLDPAGVLRLAAPLDYEAQDAYDLSVTATNMGGGSATASVTVHVLDRNEFPPVLLQREYRGRISEAAAAGALVSDAGAGPGVPLVLGTADGDSPANRQRAFEVLEPDAAALFRLDPTTGALRLAAPLDYERQRVHSFTVKVLDMGEPRLPSHSTAAVRVEVTNENDCAPAFAQDAYAATVLLPTVAGVRVLALAAADADDPAGLLPLKYDVLDTDAPGAFALSAAGELSVAEPAPAAGAHRLRVRVSDGVHSATARVEVRVREPDNAGLAFQKTDYYGSVLENSTRPSVVAVPAVLGAALNEHVQFRLLNPTAGFAVGASSGAVRSAGRALDREQRDSYTLLLQARSGPRVAHARLHVAVTDVNDNCPVFVQRPYVAAVRAGAEPGTPVLRVRAVDADANDNGEVRYEMKRGHGELFRVDRRSGQISLKQTLDARSEPYALVIAAFDGGTPACGAEAAVAVRVWAGGAAPSWAAAHVALSAREDAAPGAALGGPLTARSPLARPLLYTLQAGAADLFEIHFDTAPDRGSGPCSLVARAALDYEAARTHELTVRATDGVTGVFADLAVTLHVLDVNDCAPDFGADEFRASVSEAAAVGSELLTVRATDADSGANGEVSYSLAAWGGADGPLPFAVDARSGLVRVAAPLDRELRAAHHLTLTARDAGSPPQLTTAHLFVTVEDVNDCAPRMERAVLSALVSDEAARGVALARAAAWDADAAPRLRYALAGPARGLAVDERSGVLSLLDARALGALRSLNVSVSDGAHAAFARVKLSLAPANRHAPHFAHVLYEARAPENRPPPLPLTTVKAMDADAGEYGAVTYAIPSARLRELFAVDASSGALSTRVPLDREHRAEWEVPVTASDGGGRLGHTTVRVRVGDANDHAPAFPLREYRAAVAPDRAPQLPFLALAALDADAGEHARLRYAAYDGELGDAAGLFAVDALTGALALARDAAAFAGRSLQLWVRAADGGGLAGEAGVAVRVLRAGERAPRLAPPPPAVFLREDAAPGTLVAQLRAAAGGALPALRLAPAHGARAQFSLDAAGRLLLAAPLDREAAPDHVIGIIAEDPLDPTLASMVQTRLHVLDVNEHAPAFHSQPYVVQLAENTPPHSSVVQLMADDPDAGSNGEVRFALLADAPLPFAVDAHSGWVTTTAPLDREARAEYRVALEARDAGAPALASRGSLVVRVLDYNDCAPRFAQSTHAAAVREDAAPGTVLLRLAVADADAAGAPLSYFVAAGDARARFGVRAPGELYVARALDRETEPAYSLSVAATDGKFTAYTTVHVAVEDANDNPPYCVRHRYRVRLREDAPRGQPLLTLLTRDADEPHHARLRYFLSGEHADHFSIHKETGEVRVAAPLDRERVASYRLRAHAQDRDRADWACSSELLLALDDVNDNAPRFSAPLYSATLPEDAEPGTLVAKVHATDDDLGENRSVRYSFVDESAARTFALAPDSGIVTLRGALDRETLAEHRLVLRASDAGRPARSATATLRLAVADVNDNPPEFELRLYRAAVPELAAPGAELLRVHATSRDAGANAAVAYALVGGADRDDFAVHPASGVLRVARPLDYERRRAYLLTVQALDGGTPPLSDTTSVNITVTDANDNAPVFSQASYGARVREDALVGYRVVQVLANDADDGANGRVSYAIARGDRDGRFVIDADTGYVSLAAPLDRESRPAYVLELRARDRGVPALEATALLNVEVLDANDNPPLFALSNYSVVVQEDKPLGHTVLKLEVSDADAPPNAAPYTFDFQSGNEMGAFRLEQDGSLRTATRFSHRVRERYALHLRVFDNGTPPLFSDAWVHVRVVQQSQYPPVATPLEVLVNSYRDEFPGGVLGRVEASDRDAYDRLTFALAPVDGAPAPTDLFEIDPADGTLRAVPRLDVGAYRLNVTVGDGKFVTCAAVRVTVVLVSDEALAQAVLVRFRQVTDRDFVLGHRLGFLRAVREAAGAAPGDVLLLGVAAGARALLDVGVAVRAGGAWLPAAALRRRLHAQLERLEELARLVLDELPRAPCGGCEHGACAERVELRGEARSVGGAAFALVAPQPHARGSCACEPGFGGERCERAAACEACGGVLRLAGDGYLAFRLARGALAGARVPEDELLVALRFRTRAARGTLLRAAGRAEHATLELADGRVQFRMQLGAGEARLRAGGAVADGEWHAVRLERRGAGARLVVDRHAAQARAPPPAAVLDARAGRVLLGAALERHAHALAPEQVTDGFDGCIADVTLGGVRLPLEEGGTSADGRAQLVRSVNALVADECAPLPEPDACSAQPCRHGGTCRARPDLAADAFECACHARFLGRRCELDSDPCASQPCLHGGFCAAEGEGAFRCACAAGLEGARCERGRWCAPGACAHGGECEEGEWGPSCRCRGYYGPSCQYDVDECAGEPCLNGATCLNEPGSFRCLCPPDKTGMHCGNPLHSDAVVAGDAAGGGRALRELWRWALAARWPLGAAAGALLLLLLLALLPAALRRRARAPPAADKLPPRSKLSNLEAVRRGRPASCAAEPPLNNIDTLRSYGSAGDELEGIPPDYLRNLNLHVEPAERKPWSEQMHLHTFADNKIYNDLKACNTRVRVPSPSAARRPAAAPAGPGEPHLLGGYHWDCSDWCGGGALPGISEVAGSERPDSSSPPSPRPPRRAPPDVRQSDSATDDPDALSLAAAAFLLDDEYSAGGDGDSLRARAVREPDAHSLITMLEERHSLLGGSGSDLSANLCEIEDSEAEEDAPAPPPRHSDV